MYNAEFLFLIYNRYNNKNAKRPRKESTNPSPPLLK